MLHRTPSVGTYTAKTHFSELIERVEAGEEITITEPLRKAAKKLSVKLLGR